MRELQNLVVDETLDLDYLIELYLCSSPEFMKRVRLFLPSPFSPPGGYADLPLCSSSASPALFFLKSQTYLLFRGPCWLSRFCRAFWI